MGLWPQFFVIYQLLAGPRFGFARNDFEFVLIGACVHALIALLQPVITTIYFCYSTDLAFLRRPKRPPSFKDLTKQGYLMVASKVLFPERYICKLITRVLSISVTHTFINPPTVLAYFYHIITLI